MPSAYLQDADKAPYGVPTATAAQIQQASILIDALIKRPEGLTVGTDTAGNPVYMAAAVPTGTFTAGALAPGTNVAATLAGPLTTLKKGDVLVAEKSVGAKAEPLVVASLSGASVVFETVTKAHDAGVSLDAGLVIRETRHIPTGRQQTILSRAPILRLLSARGKYGSSRRGRSSYPMQDEYNLVSIVAQFTGGDVWESINVAYMDFDSTTGQVWLPSGLLMGNYTEVDVSYLAGFTQASIPANVKQVAANLINGSLATSGLTGNVKSFRAGDTQIERFLSSMFGSDERAMLREYYAKAYA